MTDLLMMARQIAGADHFDLPAGTGLSVGGKAMFGPRAAAPVITDTGIVQPRVVTKAMLADAATYPELVPGAGQVGRMVWCTDRYGGFATMLYDTGAQWTCAPGATPGIAFKAAADVTLVVSGARVVVIDAALTADMLVKLSASGASEGDTFRIVRSDKATGAPNVNVQYSNTPSLTLALPYVAGQQSAATFAYTGQARASGTALNGFVRVA